MQSPQSGGLEEYAPGSLSEKERLARLGWERQQQHEVKSHHDEKPPPYTLSPTPKPPTYTSPPAWIAEHSVHIADPRPGWTNTQYRAWIDAVIIYTQGLNGNRENVRKNVGEFKGRGVDMWGKSAEWWVSIFGWTVGEGLSKRFERRVGRLEGGGCESRYGGENTTYIQAPLRSQ